MKLRLAARLAAAPLVVAAPPVHAHLVETGFGAFYDGVAHVLSTPGDLLVIVALALLAGQRGTRASRWTIVALPLGWLAGGVVGATGPSPGTFPLLTTLSFALAGALVALAARLRDAGVAALALGAGMLHGLVNGTTTALALAGAMTATAFVATVVSAEVTALRADWSRIAVRVAGSWIAASGVLMAGWLARTTPA